MPSSAHDASKLQLPAGACCATHPTVPAAAVCARCGVFVCADDVRRLDGVDHCTTCASRPDVDYLEALRLKLWGRRNGWAWFFGFSGLVSLLQGGSLPLWWISGEGAAPNGTQLLGAAVTAAHGVFGVLFWLGKPFARWGLLGTTAIGGVIAASGLPSLDGPAIWFLGPAWLVGLAIVASAVADVRTRLFLKLDVSREALRRLHDVTYNNARGRQAAVVGLAGFLVPFLAPVAIILGIIGLTRVDPSARPPIGYRGRSIAGVVLGALGILWWVAILAVPVLARPIY